MTDSTLGIVVNWRRPGNIQLVLDSLRQQTMPLTIALCECAPGTIWETPKGVQGGFDIVFTVSHNIGPTSRFIPALAMPQFTYAFFQVDDFLPGPECVEHMHQTAQNLNGEFATIGQDGNCVNGDVLRRKRIEQLDEPVSVDIVVSSELARTADVVHAVTLHSRLAERYPEALPCFEDDMLLCMGIQMYCNWPSYLTPRCDPKASYRLRDLPAPNGLWMRPDHYENRNKLVAKIRELGWQSHSCK
jgi:hypothetical protein